MNGLLGVDGLQDAAMLILLSCHYFTEALNLLCITFLSLTVVLHLHTSVCIC